MPSVVFGLRFFVMKWIKRRNLCRFILPNPNPKCLVYLAEIRLELEEWCLFCSSLCLPLCPTLTHWYRLIYTLTTKSWHKWAKTTTKSFCVCHILSCQHHPKISHLAQDPSLKQRKQEQGSRWQQVNQKHVIKRRHRKEELKFQNVMCHHKRKLVGHVENKN